MAYVCNTSNIKEMKCGRPQTVMFLNAGAAAATYPNGTIVTLGDTIENKNIHGVVPNTAYGRVYDHVHEVTKVTNIQQVIGKWIIVAPEINVEEYRRIDGQLAKFVLEEETTYSAYELQKHDRIEYTEEYFHNPAEAQVGRYVKVHANGKFEVDLVGNANNCAFRIVSILDTHLPFTLAVNGQPNQGAALLPTVGKKIKLEVVR